MLFDGQVLTVQVIKDPIGTKGARLSTQISIAGRMLVYLPQDKHIGISQKIERSGARTLRARLQSLLPPMKKAASSCAPWPRTRPTPTCRPTSTTCARPGHHHARRAHAPATSLLHQDLSLAQRVLRDFVGDETATIQVDSRENYVKLRSSRQSTPSVLPRLQHYTGERPLFDLYGVEEEILRAWAAAWT
jgi:ribonuclease G